jgi:hypothetical protein
MPRSRALDRGRDAGAPAGLRERQHVVGPGSLVEVGRDEPACVIREQRIGADDVPLLEVIEDHLIRHREERLVRTLPTLDTGLLPDAPYLFVRACRRVPLSAGRGVGPELRVQVIAAPEELAEQGHLFGGRPWVGLSREATAAHGRPPAPRRRPTELSAPRGGPRPVGARRPGSRAELSHERWPSEGRPRRMMSWGLTRSAAGPHQITHLTHASWPLVSEVRTESS